MVIFLVEREDYSLADSVGSLKHRRVPSNSMHSTYPTLRPALWHKFPGDNRGSAEPVFALASPRVTPAGSGAHLQSAPSRLLQRVRDVRSDRARGVAHEDEVARVDHQVAVPKHGAALAHQHIGVACGPQSLLRARRVGVGVLQQLQEPSLYVGMRSGVHDGNMMTDSALAALLSSFSCKM